MTSTNLLHAQNTQFNAENYLENSISIQKKGMVVLGSWALINIFSGIPGSLKSNRDTKYLFQMNAAWNVVNLGIASVGYIGAMNGYNLQSEAEILKEMQNFDRILLINAGLDLAYIATGTWLWNRGLRNHSSRLNGYGKSLVLQGSFLLLFDTVLYLIHHQKTTEFLSLNGQISFTGNGFSLAF
ncbi:MAG: hypothetical protein BalsKO_18530 [Balneolaceae bacterium]